MTATPRRKGNKVIVLGYMFRGPVAGVVWQTLHYLLGLERLGYDVFYLECHGRWVPDPHTSLAGHTLDRFGMRERWACAASDEQGLPTGPDAEELRNICKDADVLINLSGFHAIQELDCLCEIPHRIYVETDPVVPQLLLESGDRFTADLLEAHTHLFSFGQNIGASGSLVPETGYSYRPTRQPVLLDLWTTPLGPTSGAFTTIGQWRNQKVARKIGHQWRRMSYSWSKHLEFAKFIELPHRTGRTFELALVRIDPDEREHLRANGWGVADADTISSSLDSYRLFIQKSRAEFTVAKDLNVRLRSGWFSDRSACYLAAGRPVITQDTGFGDVLPTGEGLFGFRTLEDAVAAVEAIASNPEHHQRAAREIASEYFDAAKVLTDLLGD